MTRAAEPSGSPDGASGGLEPRGELDLLLPLRSAGALEDPAPVYSLLRAVRPIMQLPVPGHAGPGVWFLTRYREVEWALRDPRLSVDRLRAPILRDNLERLPDFVRRTQQGA